MKKLLQTAGDYVRRRAYYLLWSAWVVLLVEFLSRGAVGETLLWPLRRFPLFLVTTLFVCCLLLLVTSAVGRSRIALGAVAVLAAIAAGISGIKLRMLGLPLLPWDVKLMNEATDVVKVSDIITVKLVVGLLLFAASGVLLAVKLGRERPLAKERLVAAAVTVCLLAGTYFAPPAVFGTRDMPYDQALNVRTNGFLLSELFNVRTMSSQSRGLDTKAVEAFAAKSAEAAEAPKTPGSVKPNIIVVLSESFFDLTKLPGVTYSQDPIAFYHSLAEKYSSGTILSPQFGGATANVEWEVLTGLSMRFMPQGTIVYNQYLDKVQVDSLASILARQGYVSTAISPWPNWFFNNNKVYRNMGFHRMIPVEFMRWVFSGPNIPDDEIANLIMAETGKTAGPDFVFANTGENHYPYPPDKFERNTIQVQGLTDPSSTSMLETYAQGATSADKMLKKLVEHYTETKEPTIIVWFGDHFPTMGQDWAVYKESKFITGEEDPEFWSKMYRTPVLVWNNYLPEHRDSLDMSPSFLSPYVLDVAKLPGTPLTEYLKSLSARVPVIPPQRLWEAQHIPQSDMDQYGALEQDILFGEQKTYGDLKGKIVDPTYELGYGPISLDRADVDAPGPDGGTAITLHGSHIPPRGVIYVGGTAVKTRWVDYETTTATVPADLARTKPWDVELRLIDTDSVVIARSNHLSIQP